MSPKIALISMICNDWKGTAADASLGHLLQLIKQGKQIDIDSTASFFKAVAHLQIHLIREGHAPISGGVLHNLHTDPQGTSTMERVHAIVY